MKRSTNTEDSSGNPRYFMNMLPSEPLETSKLGPTLGRAFLEVLTAVETNALSGTAPVGGSLYTGIGGVAYMYLHLFRLVSVSLAARETLQKAERDLAASRGEPCMPYKTTPEYLFERARHWSFLALDAAQANRRVTLLEGGAGSLVLQCVLHFLIGEYDAANEALSILLDMMHHQCESLGPKENELLYGRAGYISALQNLRSLVASLKSFSMRPRPAPERPARSRPVSPAPAPRAASPPPALPSVRASYSPCGTAGALPTARRRHSIAQSGSPTPDSPPPSRGPSSATRYSPLAGRLSPTPGLGGTGSPLAMGSQGRASPVLGRGVSSPLLMASLPPLPFTFEAAPRPEDLPASAREFLDMVLSPEGRLNAVIKEHLADVLQNGVRDATASDATGSPLNYTWHGKNYLGLAHGLSGILYTIAAERSRDLTHGATRGFCGGTEWPLLRDAALWLTTQAFPASGNLASSFGSTNDRLVQFCHGAPGLIYALSAVLDVHRARPATFVLGVGFCPSGVSNLAVLEEAIVAAGAATWERGLLRKGAGLCHGVAGNGYALLRVYRCLNEDRWLGRAQQFALWIAENWKGVAEQPDHPYALYEGLAGAACFLGDVLDPGAARFPAFEFDSS